MIHDPFQRCTILYIRYLLVYWIWATLYLTLWWVYFRMHRNTSVFSIISWHWYHTGSWNICWGKTRTCLSYINNVIAANGLVMQGAQAWHKPEYPWETSPWWSMLCFPSLSGGCRPCQVDAVLWHGSPTCWLVTEHICQKAVTGYFHWVC